IGSLKPLTYDAAWLARLVGPGGALGGLAREYLAVDAPEHYFGHLLLDSSGVARLVERATIVHRDNRPRLEFVAARRFLDTGTQGGRIVRRRGRRSRRWPRGRSGGRRPQRWRGPRLWGPRAHCATPTPGRG